MVSCPTPDAGDDRGAACGAGGVEASEPRITHMKPHMIRSYGINGAAGMVTGAASLGAGVKVASLLAASLQGVSPTFCAVAGPLLGVVGCGGAAVALSHEVPFQLHGLGLRFRPKSYLTGLFGALALGGVVAAGPVVAPVFSPSAAPPSSLLRSACHSGSCLFRDPAAP